MKRIIRRLLSIRFRYRLGLLLAVANFACLLLVVIPIVVFPDAQWEMTWMVMWGIDLPISFLLFPLLRICPGFSIPGIPYPISEFRSFLFPFLFFGIVGGAWYFFLPSLTASVIEKIRFLRQRKRFLRIPALIICLITAIILPLKVRDIMIPSEP